MRFVVEPADVALIARALLFTAGEDAGGVDTEMFDDDERAVLVGLGRWLAATALELEGRQT